MEWSKIQNGSDIRGVAMEGIKGIKVNLTPEIVEILGNSFVYWLEKQGWFLIKMSLHDPVMDLNVESDIEGGVKAIISSLHELLHSFSGLDYSSISE